MRTVLLPEWTLDGESLEPKNGYAVVLESTRIKDVLPENLFEIRESDQVVKLPNQSLMPGLINNHVHSILPGDKTPFVMSQLDTDVAFTLRAVANMKQSLHSGVTMVRDCGGKNTTTTELRDFQKSGQIEGSRMFCSGWPITITGGHVRYFGGEAEGEEGLTRMVRRLVGTGVDFIKVMASGGGTPGSLSHYPAYTLKEMKLIVALAHGFGKLVAAHCIATDSIEQAIDAGVDMIEHALFFAPDSSMKYDERVAEKLAKSKIPVTTTLCPASDYLDTVSPEDPGYDYRKQQLNGQYEIFANLKELGVPLLAGSDAGWLASPFTGFWKELYELTNCGLTPVEAINAATSLPAKVLQLDEQFGTLKPGKLADLTVVEGNVAEDIQCIKKVKLVYQNGLLVNKL